MSPGSRGITIDRYEIISSTLKIISDTCSFCRSSPFTREITRKSAGGESSSDGSGYGGDSDHGGSSVGGSDNGNGGNGPGSDLDDEIPF